MEVMEDGNLMDKVQILIQRDMEYYKANQSVLQETLCPGIIGGRLDFPRSASFAAVKLVIWWEEEYVAAYRKPSGFFQKNNEGTRDSIETSGGCGGIARSSDPSKFIDALSKSAEEMLEHLHILTQEALDHADLTVLTGTIGAAALLKNSLWYYTQILVDSNNISIKSLQRGYKKYKEMCEALAERLLDLHCRLVSLYILQDAICLDWQSNKAFFESERGSYVIQMWWLYMQGTREDLWSTVPPKMAQRIFSGMLNESLTILTTRYTHCLPSKERSQLLLVDISNLLLCVAQLLPAICDSADELVNFPVNSQNKILRDIHLKCEELFISFVMRGSTIDALNKVFGKEKDNVNLFRPRIAGMAGWITFFLPNILRNTNCNKDKLHYFESQTRLAIDLIVLLGQPQPNWALLLKVLCSNNFLIPHLLLTKFLDKFNKKQTPLHPKAFECGKILCPADGSCRDVDSTSDDLNFNHDYNIIYSAVQIIIYLGSDEELKQLMMEFIMKNPEWVICFERYNVWNQIRFPWFEAILSLADPIRSVVRETVTNALKTGATMYQAMSLILVCLSQFWDMIDPCLLRISCIIQDIIPSSVRPNSQSVLMQILTSSLYSDFVDMSKKGSAKKEVTFKDVKGKEDDISSIPITGGLEDDLIGSTMLAAAEGICSIDEDNKHTDQIAEFLNQVAGKKDEFMSTCNTGSERVNQNPQLTEILVSDLLMDRQAKKSLNTLFRFIKHNCQWLYGKLGIIDIIDQKLPNTVLAPTEPILHKMFHIGYYPFDEVLTKSLNPDWQYLLQTPIGLTLQKAWIQISQRWEFQNTSTMHISAQDLEIINYLSALLKQ